MHPDQADRIKAAVRQILAWQPDRVIWDNEPRPSLAGSSDASRVGFVELSVLQSSGVGGHADEQRETRDEAGNRIRTHHKMRLVSLQFDCYSLQPKVGGMAIAERILSGFQDEAIEADNEASEISIFELGTVRSLSFRAEGGKFDRATVDIKFYMAWDEVDATAEAATIHTASADVEYTE